MQTLVHRVAQRFKDASAPAGTGGYPCSRCGGEGRIWTYSNVVGGICFKCNGTGRQSTKPRTSPLWVVFGIRRDTGEEAPIFEVKAPNMKAAVERAILMFKAYSGWARMFDLDESNAKAVPSTEAGRVRLPQPPEPDPEPEPELPSKPVRYRSDNERELAEQLRALPAFRDRDILQSFVEQLESGRTLSPAQLGIVRKFMPVSLETSQWQSMRDEGFELMETRLVKPALAWFGHYQGPHKDAVDWMADEVRKSWDGFKQRPRLGIEASGEGRVSFLAEDCGYRARGVTGALDALARIDQLARKGQKAPASALKAMRAVEQLLDWLRHLSPSKIEQTLEQQYR